MNKKPKFTSATEPTNIIWENRHIKGIDYGARVFGALLITGVMMSLTFAMIIAFKQTSIKYQSIYPKVDCNAIMETFSDEGEL